MKKYVKMLSLVFFSTSVANTLYAQKVCFLPQDSNPVGVAPVGSTTGDYDNDGNIDIVTTNQTGTYSILLGDGTGNFAATVNSGGGTQPYGVATGDFNEDGNDDLVFTNLAGPVVISVVLGNGDGSFGAIVNYTAASVPRDVEVEDFNNDGHEDLAVCNTGTLGPFPTLSVFLGTGTGTFGVAAYYFITGINGSGYDVTCADFDNDLDMDIAVAVLDTGVKVWANNGDGTFVSGMSYPVDVNILGICSDDFDSDGNPDIAAVDNLANRITILMGNGDLSFDTSLAPIGLGNNPRSVDVGDFNRDGNPDLVVPNAGDQITVLVGDPTGNFTAIDHFPVENSPNAASVADFNNDNKLDIVVANQAAFTASVLINNAPDIDVTSSDDTLCIDSTAILTASGCSTYSWDTGDSGPTADVSPVVDTDYLVIGADATGCENGFLYTQLVEDCGIGGIGGGETEPALTVYPNPFVDEIHIANFSEGSFYSLEDVSGRVVEQGKILTGTLNFSNLSPGYFVLRVENVEGNAVVLNIVRQ